MKGGESTLEKGKKWWCITNIRIYSELFLGDNVLAILNSSKKNLEFAWQFFVIQNEL
jgi:hypothetical protein